MSLRERRRVLKSASLLPLLAVMRPANDFASDPSAEESPSASALTHALPEDQLFFKISLAEWSFNQDLFSGKMKNIDLPQRAVKEFNIHAVEYVNQFFMDKAKDKMYLKALKQRSNDLGVTNIRIMCDLEGDMGETNKKKRKQAVENHFKWVEAAQILGCKDIRVNVRGNDQPEAIAKAAVQSLSELTEFSRDYNVDVLVENHGGLSSNAAWIVNVIKEVNNPHCGLLPDWGNFCLEYATDKAGNKTCVKHYDRYKGVKEMMPYAKGISAKSFAFDDQGNETTIDFKKMVDITRDAGFTGYIGIEFEGNRPEIAPEEGVARTLALLKKWRKV